MKRFKLLLLLLFIIQLVIPAQKKEIVAYYPEWGARQQRYYVKNIETSGSAGKITVLNYAFVEPAPDSLGNIVPRFMSSYYDYQQSYSSANSIDGVADDSTQPLRGQFNQLKKLKSLHPHLKIIISLGGWTGSKYFSDLALTSTSRELFVNDCINKFIKGNLPNENNSGGSQVAKGIFDGFDIDWEFPVDGGDDGIHHNKNDRDNLSALFALFRQKLDEINPHLLLTAAVPAGVKDSWKFNFNKDQKLLSWYNLMTYDFHGSWDTITYHHTNLLGNQNSFANTISYFRDTLGLAGNKIIPGAAFYGHGWKVSDTINSGLFRPGTAVNTLDGSGADTYRGLNSLLQKGYEYKWDDSAMAPWLFNPADSVFWSYDDTKSISLKTHYVFSHDLRGIMFWEISGDDPSGTLVNTIYSHNMPDIQPPEKFSPIKITRPQPSELLTPGSDVIIKTNKGAENNTVAKVEFFCDNHSLGFDTKPPFNWVWFNAPAGKHRIKVIATYNDLKKKSSHSVILNVKINRKALK